MKTIIKLLACFLVLVGISYADSVSNIAQKVTDLTVSSGTHKAYLIGRSTVCVTTTSKDRVVGIYNAGTVQVWKAYRQSISTYTFRNGAETGFPIPAGDTQFPTFRGDMYFVNDDLSISSSTVYIWIDKDDK